MNQELTHEELEHLVETEPISPEDIKQVLHSLLRRDKEVREFCNRLHNTVLASIEVSELLLQSLSPLMSTMNPSIQEQIRHTHNALDEALNLLRPDAVKH